MSSILKEKEEIMVYLDVNEIPIREVLLKYSRIEKEVKEKDGYKCCCPIHNDSTPSFKVFEKDNSFFCFGCSAAGKTVDLVRMIHKFKTNEEAEKLLEKEFDIEEDSIPTLEGLCERKGLDIRVANGMMGWNDTDNGVMIPYYGLLPEQQGRAYPTYKIRTSYTGKGEKPKYIKDGTNTVIPYGLNLLSSYDPTKPLYLTEGETDTITMVQAGFQALGIPGATTFKKDFVDYINPYALLIVVLDSDKAGERLLRTIVNLMGEERKKVFFMPMPQGVKDINTFHCTTCRKDIKIFKEKVNMLSPVPATLEGFKLLADIMPGANIVTGYNIDNYIKHVIGDDRIEIDKFIQELYNVQGKELRYHENNIKGCCKTSNSSSGKGKRGGERGTSCRLAVINYSLRKMTITATSV